MSPAVPYRVVGFHILPLATYAANNVGYPAFTVTSNLSTMVMAYSAISVRC